MSMWARYDTASKKLLHWSTVPFTTAPGTGEADTEFPDGTTLPGPFVLCRRASDLASIGLDAVPPPPPDPDEELDAAIAAATTLAELKDALRGRGGTSRAKGRPV